MIPRIYIDTSVVGGCFDEEYEKESKQLWREFSGGMKIAVASDLLLFELEEAPARVRQLLKDLPVDSIEYVALDEESIALANAYLRDGAVAESSLSDARHIAGDRRARRCVGELEFQAYRESQSDSPV